MKKLRIKLNAEMVLLTLSENGVYIDYDQGAENQNLILPSHVRNISDVSGAGDTVISVASLCLAKRTDPSVLAAISNLAGGQVCEKVGVVSVDRERLLKEAIELL
ncbi:MAG: PfkB family carbohydrate kinase [Bacteroidales bacterium]